MILGIYGLSNSGKTTLVEQLVVELTQRGMNKYRNLFARAINLENISFKLDDEFINI